MYPLLDPTLRGTQNESQRGPSSPRLPLRRPQMRCVPVEFVSSDYDTIEALGQDTTPMDTLAVASDYVVVGPHNYPSP